jgi:hypothetical protein
VNRRTLRLAAVAVLAAVALPLAACQNHQGTAAYVGDTRITNADVQNHVDKFYEDPFWAKQAEGQRAVVQNRTVNVLIIAEVLKYMARDEGIKVPESAVKAAEAIYKKEPQQIPRGLQGAPIRTAAEVAAYLEALQNKFAKGATSPDELNQRLTEALETAHRRHPVTVNPRYGTYDPKLLGLKPGHDAGVRDLAASPEPPGQEPR